MSLLREIQNAAVDSSADILTMLRKCRILASRLNHTALKNWVQHELDGYPPDVALPDYRIVRVESKGHFVGPYGRELRNAPIPAGIFGDKVRSVLEQTELRESASYFVDLLKQEGPAFRDNWPADVLHIFHGKVYEGMALAQAWKEIPRGTFVGILESVRSRVLNFALEIEAENPQAGDAEPGSTPVSEKKVTHIFNTTINGSVGNIASGGSHFQQTAAVQIAAGNTKQLRDTVTALGLSDGDVAELEKAIESDPPLKPQKPFGKKVGAWVGNALGKAAQGLLKVSTEVAAETLSRTIKDFCGLPPSL